MVHQTLNFNSNSTSFTKAERHDFLLHWLDSQLACFNPQLFNLQTRKKKRRIHTKKSKNEEIRCRDINKNYGLSTLTMTKAHLDNQDTCLNANLNFSNNNSDISEDEYDTNSENDPNKHFLTFQADSVMNFISTPKDKEDKPISTFTKETTSEGDHNDDTGGFSDLSSSSITSSSHTNKTNNSFSPSSPHENHLPLNEDDAAASFRTCHQLLKQLNVPEPILRQLDEAYSLSQSHPDILSNPNLMNHPLMSFFQPFVPMYLHLIAEVDQLQQSRIHLLQKIDRLMVDQAQLEPSTTTHHPNPTSRPDTFLNLLQCEEHWMHCLSDALLEETQWLDQLKPMIHHCQHILHTFASTPKPMFDPNTAIPLHTSLIKKKQTLQAAHQTWESNVFALQQHYQKTQLQAPWLLALINLFRPLQENENTEESNKASITNTTTIEPTIESTMAISNTETDTSSKTFQKENEALSNEMADVILSRSNSSTLFSTNPKTTTINSTANATSSLPNMTTSMNSSMDPSSITSSSVTTDATASSKNEEMATPSTLTEMEPDSFPHLAAAAEPSFSVASTSSSTSSSPLLSTSFLVDQLFSYYRQAKHQLYQTTLSHLHTQLHHLQVHTHYTQLLQQIFESAYMYVHHECFLNPFSLLMTLLQQGLHTLPLHYQPLHEKFKVHTLASKSYLKQCQSDLRHLLISQHHQHQPQQHPLSSSSFSSMDSTSTSNLLHSTSVMTLARLETQSVYYTQWVCQEETRLQQLEQWIIQTLTLLAPYLSIQQLNTLKCEFSNLGLTIKIQSSSSSSFHPLLSDNSSSYPLRFLSEDKEDTNKKDENGEASTSHSWYHHFFQVHDKNDTMVVDEPWLSYFPYSVSNASTLLGNSHITTNAKEGCERKRKLSTSSTTSTTSITTTNGSSSSSISSISTRESNRSGTSVFRNFFGWLQSRPPKKIKLQQEEGEAKIETYSKFKNQNLNHDHSLTDSSLTLQEKKNSTLSQLKKRLMMTINTNKKNQTSSEHKISHSTTSLITNSGTESIDNDEKNKS
ncbi:hypothetical protein HMI54_003291 [Coelomomyces lativittatus]|nr:hypothetical protein HMI54_003291 [Coelomomyces lativittatus]KAJ1509719.1 hypothetical protein HMI55_007280 [Coelomomyces lativittatus]KAJ1512964.1 hypothetical protein HMI56_003251 [Coelomomyces lativittatus]